jgi:hypothetical protein
MTLVPEGGVWNYGVGLTQSWSDKIAYNMTLDKPESFWAPCHRPVSLLPRLLEKDADDTRTISSTLLLWRVTMLRMWRTVWLKKRRRVYGVEFRGFGILSCLYKWATSTALRIMQFIISTVGSRLCCKVSNGIVATTYRLIIPFVIIETKKQRHLSRPDTAPPNTPDHSYKCTDSHTRSHIPKAQKDQYRPRPPYKLIECGPNNPISQQLFFTNCDGP